MQLELFGNLESKRYWVAEAQKIAIGGTEQDLSAWLHHSRNRRGLFLSPSDFRQVSCREQDLAGYRVIHFHLSRELVRHPVYVAQRATKHNTPKKERPPELQDW